MNMFELLKESLYDLSFLKGLNKYIINSIDSAPMKRNGYKVLNVTKFIPPEYNKKNLTVLISFKEVKEDDPENYASWSNYNSKTKEVWYQLHRDAPYKEARERDKPYEYDVNRHEIIHMLDFLRDKTSRGDKDIKDLSPDASDTSESSDDKGLLHYVKDPGELNVAIHVLSIIKVHEPKLWKSITSYNELIELLILRAPLGFEGAGKHVLKDNDLKKTILRRLYREKLMPPNMTIN